MDLVGRHGNSSDMVVYGDNPQNRTAQFAQQVDNEQQTSAPLTLARGFESMAGTTNQKDSEP